MGNNRLSLTLAYQNNQRDEYGNPTYPTEQSIALKLQTITYAARFHLKEKRGWKKEIGFNGMAQNNTNKGKENIIPEYHLLDYGVYSYVEKEINHLNLCGGLRYDNRSIGIDNNEKNTSSSFQIFDKSFTNFSGSIGITYVPNEFWVFKSNIARAFRAPGISELASNGAHEGTNRFEHGNIDLKSEISTQFDASIEFNSKHFNLNIAGYLNQFDQFIFYRKLQSFTGLDSVIENDGNTFYAFQFQQQAAKLFGTEVTLDIHPHPLDWLHIENALSLVRGLFNQSIENNKNMPFIPAPRLLSQCRADFKKVSNTIRNAYLKIEADNVFIQRNAFTAYNTETPTLGYTIINAGIGGTFYNHKGKELLSVALNAQNITDVAYQNHLSRLKYTAVNSVTQRTGVFNMGRNIALKINWPFQFNIR
jgi:iron complex outermembrane receptor protein